MTLGVEHLTTHEKVLGLVAHGDTTLVDMMEEMEGNRNGRRYLLMGFGGGRHDI